MQFTSLSYLIFLPLVFILYWLLPSKHRWMLLLTSSAVFYLTWTQVYAVLIVITTLSTYLAGLALDNPKFSKQRKSILLMGILIPLGQLFFFKYAGFFGSIVSDLKALVTGTGLGSMFKLMLPVGISFYTFQTIGYVVDVYKGTMNAEKHLGYYALFVTFFPQLLSGPIARARLLLPQLKKEKTFDYTQATTGLKMMAWGFFKKLVIADYLAITVNQVYDHVQAYTGFALVLATLLFSIQIYCDFSGYTDIAIGTAKLLGIDLMKNFDSPYFSKSIKEFWSRWHISLSTWFREYVYFPLGGNRVKVPSYLLNLFLTFLISGLWHGANWTFILWGAMHGTFMIIEALMDRYFKPKSSQHKLFITIFKTIWTFTLVSLAWVLFRANSVEDAFTVYTNLFNGILQFGPYLQSGFKAMRFSDPDLFRLALILPVLFIVDVLNLKKSVIDRIQTKPLILRWSVYVLFGLLAIMTYTLASSSNFIYFKF